MSESPTVEACRQMMQAAGYFVIGDLSSLRSGDVVTIYPEGLQEGCRCRIVGPATISDVNRQKQFAGLGPTSEELLWPFRVYRAVIE